MAVPARKTRGRAMTSPVNWAVLGLVIERPSYGLELAQRLMRAYGDVLPVSESHVYAALNALAHRRLVEVVLSGETERQPKPRYKATAVGRRAYEDWLVAQAEMESRRQELWVRELGVFVRDPEAALRVLERFESQCLKGAGGVGRRDGSAVDPRTELIDALVAERQRVATDGLLKWLPYVQARFEGLAGTADDVA
jgi:DNA-binding PadR family transcriptional regulator